MYSGLHEKEKPLKMLSMEKEQENVSHLLFGSDIPAQINQSIISNDTQDKINWAEEFGYHKNQIKSEPLQGKDLEIEMPTNSQNYKFNSGKKLNIPEILSERVQDSFGIDLSELSLLESPEVDIMGAQATTQGNIIRFAPGKYNPNTTEGRELLGHELNHVREQAHGKIKPNVEGTNIYYDPVHEASSDRMGEAFANGTLSGATPMSISNDTIAIQGYSTSGNWILENREEARLNELRKQTMLEESLVYVEQARQERVRQEEIAREEAREQAWLQVLREQTMLEESLLQVELIRQQRIMQQERELLASQQGDIRAQAQAQLDQSLAERQEQWPHYFGPITPGVSPQELERVQRLREEQAMQIQEPQNPSLQDSLVDGWNASQGWREPATEILAGGISATEVGGIARAETLGTAGMNAGRFARLAGAANAASDIATYGHAALEGASILLDNDATWQEQLIRGGILGLNTLGHVLVSTIAVKAGTAIAGGGLKFTGGASVPAGIAVGGGISYGGGHLVNQGTNWLEEQLLGLLPQAPAQTQQPGPPPPRILHQPPHLGHPDRQVGRRMVHSDPDGNPIHPDNPQLGHHSFCPTEWGSPLISENHPFLGTPACPTIMGVLPENIPERFIPSQPILLPNVPNLSDPDRPTGRRVIRSDPNGNPIHPDNPMLGNHNFCPTEWGSPRIPIDHPLLGTSACPTIWGILPDDPWVAQLREQGRPEDFEGPAYLPDLPNMFCPNRPDFRRVIHRDLDGNAIHPDHPWLGMDRVCPTITGSPLIPADHPYLGTAACPTIWGYLPEGFRRRNDENN